MKRLFQLLACLALFALPARAQLTSQGNEQVISYSGAVANILNSFPVNPGLLTTTGTNTFIMSVNPASNSLRLYITNDTVNACANITVSVASTGNAALNSFNSTPGAWQSVLLQAGSTPGFASSQSINLPASGTIAFTSAPIVGTRIALFIVLSGGCATTSVDANVVFGTFTATSPNVQGIVPAGQSGLSENPLVCGGIDASNNVQFCGAFTKSFGPGQPQTNGLAIGAPGQSSGAEYVGIDMPNGGGGPLGITQFAVLGNGPASSYVTGNEAPVIQTGNNLGNNFNNLACNTQGNGCPGLETADSGFIIKQTVAPVTTNSTTNVGNVDQGRGSEFQTCRLDLNTHNNSGTTPTLDVYVQDSADNVNFTDRVHFPQATTTDQKIYATVSAFNLGAGSTPTLYQDAALAVNTIAQGAWAANIRLKFVVSGTGPSYNVTFWMNCK
jgi:hypothetical protein